MYIKIYNHWLVVGRKGNIIQMGPTLHPQGGGEKPMHIKCYLDIEVNVSDNSDMAKWNLQPTFHTSNTADQLLLGLSSVDKP